MKGRVVICGNMSLDTIVRPVGDAIGWDKTVAVEQMTQHLGGNGASSAYTLGKMEVPVTLISLAGRDAAAEDLLARLRKVGVDCRVEQGELPTSLSVSLVDSDGRRALMYHLGASDGEFPKPMEFPDDAGHFHLCAMYRMRDLRKHGAALLRKAKRAGLSTSVDAQWDHLGEWPPMPPADLWFVNEDEAREMTGMRDPEEAAAALRTRGAGVVVVKLGSKGCMVSTSHEVVFSAGVPVEAVDTTGAGDCFCGAYLAGLYRGEWHGEAARLGNKVAALSVTDLGATAALDSGQFSSL